MVRKSSKNPKNSPRQHSANTPSIALQTSTGGSVSGDNPLEGEPILIFSGIPGIERIKVFREDERTRKPVFHGNLPVDETTVDRVTELFGGGKYILRATARDAAGAEVFATARTIVIPGLYKQVTGPLPGVGVPVVTGGVVTPFVGTFPSNAGQMRELMESALMTRMLDMVQRAPMPTQDWPKLLESGVSLLLALPKIFQPGQGETAVTELLKEMRSELKAMRETPGPATNSMTDTLKALRVFREMRGLVSGDDGDAGDKKPEDPMWRVAERALDIFQGSGAGRGMAGPGEVPAGAPTAPGVPLWQQVLLEYRERLVGSASKGVEPEIAAEFVERFVPDAHRGVLIELVQHPQVVPLVLQVVPEMANFPTWLDKFVVELRAELLGEDAPETSPEEPPT